LVSLRKYILKDLHLKELFKGSFIAFLFKIFSVILTYLFFFFFAKNYGAHGLGVFNTCFTVLILSTVIAKLGLDTAIVKYLAEFVANDQKYKVGYLYSISFLMILVAGLFVSVVIFLFSTELSELFFDNSLDENLFKLTSFAIIPFAITQLNAEYFRGLKKITAYSSLQNGTVYLAVLVLIIVFSEYSRSLESVIYFLLFALISLMLISTFFVIRFNFLERSSQITILKSKFKIGKRKLLSVSIPMLFSNSLFLVMSWTDTLFLSAFQGEDSVGVYNVALKIASLNTIALIAINSIASPKFSEIYSSEGKRRFRRIVKQTTLLNWIVSLPIFFIILVFPESILTIFGSEFIDGKGALIILSIGQLISAFSGSTMIVLNMTGREKAGRNILLVTVVVNLILNYVLIPKFGIMGAAYATMISTVIWNVVSVIFIYKSFGFFTFPFSARKYEG
jgi:O-antigen/teichoic acid export membrane protein